MGTSHSDLLSLAPSLLLLLPRDGIASPKSSIIHHTVIQNLVVICSSRIVLAEREPWVTPRV